MFFWQRNIRLHRVDWFNERDRSNGTSMHALKQNGEIRALINRHADQREMKNTRKNIRDEHTRTSARKAARSAHNADPIKPTKFAEPDALRNRSQQPATRLRSPNLPGTDIHPSDAETFRRMGINEQPRHTLIFRMTTSTHQACSRPRSLAPQGSNRENDP